MLDASFAVAISADPDLRTSFPERVELLRSILRAPPIFWHEVAGALRSMRRKGRIVEAEAMAALRDLGRLRIGLEPPTADIQPVIDLSDRHQLSVYNAAYLELALRTGSRLATRDGGLIAAAMRSGLEVVTF